MFEELVAASKAPKPERTGEEEKMNLTVRTFLVAQSDFSRINEHPLKVTKKEVNYRWWCALEALYDADKALWHLFCGPDKSMASNMEYAKFRQRLISGVPSRSDA